MEMFEYRFQLEWCLWLVISGLDYYLFEDFRLCNTLVVSFLITLLVNQKIEKVKKQSKKIKILKLQKTIWYRGSRKPGDCKIAK